MLNESFDDLDCFPNDCYLEESAWHKIIGKVVAIPRKIYQRWFEVSRD